MIDHDRLFKELLTEFFGDFVDLFLPELAGYLDKASLVFLDKEIFTDITAGERHEADLVVSARFCGQDSYFLVHLEHQAQSQGDFGRRMFRYFARLHEKHAMPVYPIVLFSHDSKLPEPDQYQVAFPDLAVLQFRYRVIQLGLLNWRDYMRRANPVASALMARMGMTTEGAATSQAAMPAPAGHSETQSRPPAADFGFCGHGASTKKRNALAAKDSGV